MYSQFHVIGSFQISEHTALNEILDLYNNHLMPLPVRSEYLNDHSKCDYSNISIKNEKKCELVMNKNGFSQISSKINLDERPISTCDKLGSIVRTPINENKRKVMDINDSSSVHDKQQQDKLLLTKKRQKLNRSFKTLDTLFT